MKMTTPHHSRRSSHLPANRPCASARASTEQWKSLKCSYSLCVLTPRIERRMHLWEGSLRRRHCLRSRISTNYIFLIFAFKFFAWYFTKFRNVLKRLQLFYQDRWRWLTKKSETLPLPRIFYHRSRTAWRANMAEVLKEEFYQSLNFVVVLVFF